MRGNFRLHLFLSIITISVFVLACDGEYGIVNAGQDTALDTSLPDTLIDYVPDIPPAEPLPDVSVDTPPPDLPPDLPPDIPVADVVEEEPPPPPECPGGPYGTRVGDRIADLAFPLIDGGDVHLCDYFKDITRELLIIYGTTGW